MPPVRLISLVSPGSTFVKDARLGSAQQLVSRHPWIMVPSTWAEEDRLEILRVLTQGAGAGALAACGVTAEARPGVTDVSRIKSPRSRPGRRRLPDPAGADQVVWSEAERGDVLDLAVNRARADPQALQHGLEAFVGAGRRCRWGRPRCRGRPRGCRARPRKRRRP